MFSCRFTKITSPFDQSYTHGHRMVGITPFSIVSARELFTFFTVVLSIVCPSHPLLSPSCVPLVHTYPSPLYLSLSYLSRPLAYIPLPPPPPVYPSLSKHRNDFGARAPLLLSDFAQAYFICDDYFMFSRRDQWAGLVRLPLTSCLLLTSYPLLATYLFRTSCCTYFSPDSNLS